MSSFQSKRKYFGGHGGVSKVCVPEKELIFLIGKM